MPQKNLNPLLSLFSDQQVNFPAFGKIKPQHVEEAVPCLLQQSREKIKQLLCDVAKIKQNKAKNKVIFTWNNLLMPLEGISEGVSKVWSVASHLHSVANTPEMRKVYALLLPQVTEYFTEFGQSSELYKAVSSLAANKKVWLSLNATQRKIVEEMIRDFRLSGVALSARKKGHFAALSLELNNLANKFSNNVLDATYGWKYCAKPAEISGIPRYALAQAQAAAQQSNSKMKVKGKKYLFTLSSPSFQAVITFADTRSLRKKFYLAYVTRASNMQQPAKPGKREFLRLKQCDNSAIMERIMQDRAVMAQLLGFNNYAELSLETKMARSSAQIIKFLEDLAQKAKNKAQDELEELAVFARKKCGINKLAPWDIAYCSEKLWQEKHKLSEAELRSYFPLSRVLQGLFTIVGKLFGVEVKEINKFDTWHKDVRLFAIYVLHKGQGRGRPRRELRGYCYFDLYAREHKRNGAWMSDTCVRRKLPDGAVQLPIAYLNCNFSAPVGKESLGLAHYEVVTLFHEFGHCLQHLLTTVDYAAAASISSVPIDAVELPSQFMEHWCWQKESLRLLSYNEKLKQPMPDEMMDQLVQSKKFMSGLQLLRQLEFALFDFRLHMKKRVDSFATIEKVLQKVRRKVRLIPVTKKDRMANSFEHIFDHGYAAAYYSYKWSEMLAADAFGLFLQRGIFDEATGRSYLRNILEVGSSIDPMKAFRRFRGRKPNINALLKECGIGRKTK